MPFAVRRADFSPASTQTACRRPFRPPAPYYISSWTWMPSGQRHVRSRTRSTPARAHGAGVRFSTRFGLPLATIRQRIETGTSDYGPVPAAAHQELDTLYGPTARPPARPPAVVCEPQSRRPINLSMNTERPLFSHPGAQSPQGRQLCHRPPGDHRAARVRSRARHRSVHSTPQCPASSTQTIYPLDGPDIVQARLLAGWQPGDPLRPRRLSTPATPGSPVSRSPRSS